MTVDHRLITGVFRRPDERERGESYHAISVLIELSPFFEQALLILEE